MDDDNSGIKLISLLITIDGLLLTPCVLRVLCVTNNFLIIKNTKKHKEHKDFFCRLQWPNHDLLREPPKNDFYYNEK